MKLSFVKVPSASILDIGRLRFYRLNTVKWSWRVFNDKEGALYWGHFAFQKRKGV